MSEGRFEFSHRVEYISISLSFAKGDILAADSIIEQHAAFYLQMPRAVYVLQMPHRRADFVHGVSWGDSASPATPDQENSRKTEALWTEARLKKTKTD